MALPKSVWFDNDGALPDNPPGIEETVMEILARFTKEQIKADGSKPAGEGAGFFTLYHIGNDYIPCPFCKHPVGKDFYHCGEIMCCSGCDYDIWQVRDGIESSTLCDCAFAPRGGGIGWGRKLVYEPGVFIRVREGLWSPKVVGVEA